MHKRRIAYYTTLSDHELVALLLANNPEAIEYVFFHHCNAMFAHIVNSVFRSQVKKEELITEFYLHVCKNDWEMLRDFEFRSSLNTYLTHVAVRFFLKKRASQTKLVMTEPQLLMETLKDEADDFDVFKELSRLELYKAIERLSKPRERSAILSVLVGKSAEEIAGELNCTVLAVYNLIKKAKIEMRTLLKEREL